MKLYETLEKQLKKEPNYITDNGDLKKWVVINKAQNYDAELIGLLLEVKELKAKFFLGIKGVLVFNQSLFVQFLEQKNYLNDSYTAYKNKVGLNVDGKFLKQRNEVALVWPFKDCVLEGGQSREEDKREEIFFNATLAQDEITQLLEPKVLTNAKRYTAKDEIILDKFNRNEEGIISDNLIIKGNNLLALHSLKEEFAGKVKLIYIDPPYNTGGDANIFSYNNTFNHSTWLTFMKNRLEVAKQFLRDDGFISIAIDHFELGYLIVLSDEIFGRENRLGIISIVNNPMGRNQAKYFSTINDFMLVYAKNQTQSNFNNVVLNEEFSKTFDKEDEIGKYKLNNFIRVGGGDENLRINKKTFWYPLYVKPDLSEITIEKNETYIEVLPITASGQERTWKLSKDSTKEILNDLIALKMGDKINILEKYRLEKGQKVPTIWSDKKYNANHNGIRLLEKIIKNKEFSFPKSLYTVVDTMKIMTSKNDIIMDFHSGSATTGHAVFSLNKEDNGKRQFILVEQLDLHLKISCQRLSNVLKQENINSSFIYLELKKHNQFFIEKIESAKDTKAILEIWEEMKIKSFLNYNVDLQKQEQHLIEFKELNLKEQKQCLCELLDKNQLYVNFSSLNDKDFFCSEEEKKVTNDFYNRNNI
jgi:adenine-specific DNA-methyltransferase